MKSIILTMLFSVDPSDIIAKGLTGDQLFSIVLLIAFAVWMIRKQAAEKEEREKLTLKLEKYMEEDRKEVMALLQNCANALSQNTQVLEKNLRVMSRVEMLHQQKKQGE